ncbi:MAG TPA: LCP family protein [Solirubrobacteraceae bacterium]|jgi:LCP family protein required for cell wall assembly|nr:LCP family protein [Solirubrobacteraceae bacterium]
MPDDPRKRTPYEEPAPYRLYRAGEERPRQAARPEAASAARQERPRRAPGTESDRPYRLYSSRPRGLRARLRGEEDSALPAPRRRGQEGDELPREGGRWRRLTWRRGLAYVAIAVVAWLLVSFVLFMISAQVQSSSIPASASAALTSGGNMLTSADTILVIGTDQRPPGSKEPGAFSGGVRSDTLMLWRIGGGVSRRLSIPRDTVASIPGYGSTKINAAYAYGGPALTIKTVEQFTGLKINHVIIVNLANFPKFINAIGGIDVTTGRICSQISGGVQNGGFSLYLRPGTHHLDGTQALTLARTRENKCNAASSDLTREGYQQKILNAIKGQLLSPGTFFRLPWASWAAPQALRTDMGGFTLMSLFAASEMGGSAPVKILKPSGSEVLPGGGSALTVSPSEISRDVHKLTNG